MNASIICSNYRLLFSDVSKALNACKVVVSWATGRNENGQTSAASSSQSHFILQSSYLILVIEKKPDSRKLPFDTPAITCCREKWFDGNCEC